VWIFLRIFSPGASIAPEAAIGSDRSGVIPAQHNSVCSMEPRRSRMAHVIDRHPADNLREERLTATAFDRRLDVEHLAEEAWNLSRRGYFIRIGIAQRKFG
jgi:hypothetical protein